MGIDIPGDASEVPPDFVIAQRATLLDIADVAKRIGLEAEDIDLYGKHKAKVCVMYTAREQHDAITRQTAIFDVAGQGCTVAS